MGRGRSSSGSPERGGERKKRRNDDRREREDDRREARSARDHGRRHVSSREHDRERTSDRTVRERDRHRSSRRSSSLSPDASRKRPSGHRNTQEDMHPKSPSDLGPAGAPSQLSREDMVKKQREEEQAVLDAQMEERRRRVEEWRKKKLLEQGQADAKQMEDAKEGVAQDAGPEDGNDGPGWSLEDDEDDENQERSEGGEPGDQAANIEPEPITAMVRMEVEDDVDPLDAFMAGNSVQLVRDDDQLKQQQKNDQEDDIDPLDAFMSGHVLPVIEAPARGNADAGLFSQPSATLRYSTPALVPSKPGSGAGPARGKPVRRRKDSSDESSSDDDHEESSEEDDAEWARLVNSGKLSKGDKLGPVDHNSINYLPFRKNFYIEVPELSRLSESETVALRKEMDGIKVRGKNIPKPIRVWTQAGLSGKLLELMKKSAFERPLPIQAQAMPIIMSGRDCIGIAKTGSGKTLAFVLPMMRHIKDQPALQQGDGPVGLLMAPTRELVQQISKEIKKFAKPLSLTCVAVYGGHGVSNQISELKRGTEVIVCTPGRMIDLLVTSNGKITNLRRVTYLVLDEADRMFDMGFEPQIMRIVQNIRPDRQTVLFSATFPRQVETLARKILLDPVEIQVGGRSVVNADIDQIVEIRPEEERFPRLLEVLGEWYEKGKILVFVHSQEKCDTLFRDLLRYGYPCLSLHGGKDQSDRECTVSDFKSDVGSILVATSVAARGLDVKDLVLVMNYDVPNHHEDYVHRVGRTGRAGNKGTAITFIAEEEERYAPDLVKAIKDSGGAVPEDLLALANSFSEKRKQGLVQGHGSGYGGTGFKFDNSEQDQYKQVRKAQAKELGIEGDEEDDDDDDEGVRRVDGTSQASTSTAKPGEASIAGATISAEAMAAMAKAAATSGATAVSTAATPAAQAHIVAAQAVAARLVAGASGGSVPAISMPPPPPVPTLNTAMLQAMQSIPGVSIAPGVLGAAGAAGLTGLSMQAAAQRAAAMAAALSGNSAGVVKPHYEAELEINDFPQHARWKVTHRETITNIAELTGAAVITKGVFVPPGKNPPEGERKIYLLIEGPTETAVKRAKQELKKVLEETTEKVMRRDAPAGGMGKYSVM